MKVLFTVSSIILLFIGVQAQDWNQYDNNGEMHGNWAGYYDSGNVRYQGQFEHGKPYGTFTYYYDESQNVKMTMVYSHYDTTYATAYYDLNDGTVMAEGWYVNQMKDSLWIMYDAHGVLSSKGYYEKDTLNGTETIYYLDGSVSEITCYKMGMEDGQWLKYYENGTKQAEAVYVNGCMDGLVTYYHSNGEIELEGWYVSCTPHGYWIKYDDRGTEEDRIFYKYGQELEGDAIQEYIDSMQNQNE